MKLSVKTFSRLTADEVYDLLALRAEVFVVEQNCLYLDPDGLDRQALHVLLTDDDGVLQGYLRILPPGAVYPEPTIGRVIARKRRCGIGAQVLDAGIAAAKAHFAARAIHIEAQTHAIGFYETRGFRVVSDEFSDAGVPHVEMLLEL